MARLLALPGFPVRRTTHCRLKFGSIRPGRKTQTDGAGYAGPRRGLLPAHDGLSEITMRELKSAGRGAGHQQLKGDTCPAVAAVEDILCSGAVMHHVRQACRGSNRGWTSGWTWAWSGRWRRDWQSICLMRTRGMLGKRNHRLKLGAGE
jgi:hypothetical protein